MFSAQQLLPVLLVVVATALGVLSGRLSGVLLRRLPRKPAVDASLGALGFVLLLSAQHRSMGAAFEFVPAGLKSLLGAVLLPVVYHVLRSFLSKLPPKGGW